MFEYEDETYTLEELKQNAKEQDIDFDTFLERFKELGMVEKTSGSASATPTGGPNVMEPKSETTSSESQETSWWRGEEGFIPDEFQQMDKMEKTFGRAQQVAQGATDQFQKQTRESFPFMFESPPIGSTADKFKNPWNYSLSGIIFQKEEEKEEVTKNTAKDAKNNETQLEADFNLLGGLENGGIDMVFKQPGNHEEAKFMDHFLIQQGQEPRGYTGNYGNKFLQTKIPVNLQGKELSWEELLDTEENEKGELVKEDGTIVGM